MEQYSLFEGFELNSTKKKQEKEGKKDKSSTPKEKKPEPEKRFSFPVMIYYGNGVYEVNAENGETDIALEELEKRVGQLLKEDMPVTADQFRLAITKDHIVCLVNKNSKTFSKGSIRKEILEKGVFYYDTEIYFENLDEFDDPVDVEEIFKAARQQLPWLKDAPLQFIENKSGISAVEISSDSALYEGKGKANVILPNGEMFVIDRTNETDQIIRPADIYETLIQTNQDYFGSINNFKMVPGISGNNQIIYLVLGVEEKKEKSNPKKSEPTYSTEGTVLSLVWKRFELSPELFSGKTQVTEKELKSWLIQEKGMIELVNGRTSTRFDEKRNMIVMIMLGESKGAYWGGPENVVDNPLFQAEFDDGEVKQLILKHGKLPRSIYDAWRCFAEIFYLKRGTECQMDIYYSEKCDEYFIHIPCQKVDYSSVRGLNDALLENYIVSGCIKICEFHSHGSIAAFWSSTDISHEKREMFYMVTGGFGGALMDLVKVVVYGQHYAIRLEDLFDMRTKISENNDPNVICRPIYEKLCDIVEQRTYQAEIGVIDGIPIVRIYDLLIDMSYSYANGVSFIRQKNSNEIWIFNEEFKPRICHMLQRGDEPEFLGLFISSYDLCDYLKL